MERESVRPLVVTVVSTALLLGAAAGLLRARERWYPALASAQGDTVYVTSGPAVRVMSVGYSALAADLYWIRAIQYYGGTKLRLAAESSSPTPASGSSFDLLYPMLDLTTTLDPRFNIAYRFGAIFLAEPFPGGAGRPDLAIALLDKGLRARADKWEYMQDIGFVHYWWRHDYRAAAQWFEQASRVTGSPWWLRSLAAVTLTEGGDRRSSRIIWEAIWQSAETDWLRRDAARRILQLKALDQIDDLQKTVDTLGARTGHPITAWDALLQARLVPGIPVDPGGTPYEINPAGRVRVAGSSPLFPLPDEPHRMVAPVS